MTQDYNTEEKFNFPRSQLDADVGGIFDNYRQRDTLDVRFAPQSPPVLTVLTALVAAATSPPAPDPPSVYRIIPSSPSLCTTAAHHNHHCYQSLTRSTAPAALQPPRRHLRLQTRPINHPSPSIVRPSPLKHHPRRLFPPSFHQHFTHLVHHHHQLHFCRHKTPTPPYSHPLLLRRRHLSPANHAPPREVVAPRCINILLKKKTTTFFTLMPKSHILFWAASCSKRG